MSEKASQHDGREGEPSIDLFLGEPTRRLEDWTWLWAGHHDFPVSSHHRIWGRPLVWLKRLVRPLVKSLTSDLWERQRVFNLILIDELSRAAQERARDRQTMQDAVDEMRDRARDLSGHVAEMQHTLQGAIEDHAKLLERLDRRLAGSMTDVLAHNDALFARVDHKLDRYRREAKDLWHRLGVLIAAAESDAPAESLRQAQQEQEYLELERRYRGSEDEIAERVAAHLPYLEKVSGEVLDLGCGRGEALEVLKRHGLAVRGIDASAEMVEHCREKGLDAERAELFEHLTAIEERSLGALVSFHVIEHLPPESVERLVRLAWRALAGGGVLILETPSPLSLVMAARNFWIDPTHRRPVHPGSLEVTFREAGFEPVHRVDLHPFPDAERLPEVDLTVLPEAQRELADHVNRLRDLLDDLLFGHRDFAMIGVKPRKDPGAG